MTLCTSKSLNPEMWRSSFSGKAKQAFQTHVASFFISPLLCVTQLQWVSAGHLYSSEAASSHRCCTPHCSKKIKLAKHEGKVIFFLPYIYKEKSEVGELH